MDSGVHYVKRGKGPTAHVLYVKAMVLDWMLNQESPEAHQRAIEVFRRSLPSEQKANRRRTR